MGKTFNNDLTNRQWKLYEYLKEQEDFQNVYTILYRSELYGLDFVDKVYMENIPFNDTTEARAFRKDLRAIKMSGIIQYVILSNTKKGIKIATEKEYKEYSNKQWIAVLKRLRLLHIQDKKAGLNNQTRLVFNQEKDIIEAFNV